MSKTIRINETTVVTRGIIITMVQNYEKAFKDYLKTSKDDGFVSDGLIKVALNDIKQDLNIQ